MENPANETNKDKYLRLLAFITSNIALFSIAIAVASAFLTITMIAACLYSLNSIQFITLVTYADIFKLWLVIAAPASYYIILLPLVIKMVGQALRLRNVVLQLMLILFAVAMPLNILFPHYNNIEYTIDKYFLISGIAAMVFVVSYILKYRMWYKLYNFVALLILLISIFAFSGCFYADIIKLPSQSAESVVTKTKVYDASKIVFVLSSWVIISSNGQIAAIPASEILKITHPKK